MRCIVLLVLLALPGGCAAPTAPVTIAQALNTLQTQLQAAGALSASAATPAQFARAARQAQCAAHSADPEVPVVAGQITVTLTGSFTSNGGFAVGPAITGGPPFGLSGSLTRAQSQALTLPLTFAALSALPDVVAQSRFALAAGLPPSAEIREARRLLGDRDRLRLRIGQLIASFRPGLCGRPNGASGGPFHPLATPSVR